MQTSEECLRAIFYRLDAPPDAKINCIEAVKSMLLRNKVVKLHYFG